MDHMLCDDLAVQREGLKKAAKYWPQGRGGKKANLQSPFLHLREKAALCPRLVSVEVQAVCFLAQRK